MYKKILSAIICFIVFVSASFAQSAKQKTRGEQLLVSEVDQILQAQVDSNKIPGAIIEIKTNGRVIYENAYGWAQKYDFNHRELPSPEKMTVYHLFDIASLTKVVGTTTAIMLLVDKGLIKIDDPVGKYINAFDSGAKKAITIRHLLTHTAGLYEWYPLYYKASDKEQSYKLIGELPLKYPVGQKRSYSDLGFVLLGEIIETVSRLPLEQFEDLNIFIPLGMTSTGYNPLKTGRFKKIAATSMGNPYERRMVYDSSLGFQIEGIDPVSWNGWRNYVLRGEVNDGNAWYANDGISGAAGLFSTVEDLQKLVDVLVNKGKLGNRHFIKESTIDSFLTPDKFKNGLGWMMDTENSFMKNAPEGSFGHTGFTGTSISVIPKNNISVILLINRQQVGLLSTGDYYNVNPIRQAVFQSVLKYSR
jgi:CubicO group peptidase (beta-lactamase class C family)